MTRDCVILQESSPRLSSTGTGRLCHGRPASLIGLPEAVAGSHQSRLTSKIGVFSSRLLVPRTDKHLKSRFLLRNTRSARLY
jgi:hypothetical protein